jgi:Family of unknown function (DUF6423)
MTLRAKDLHLTATAYPYHRLVLMTGAIDRIDLTYSIQLQLPMDGCWNFVFAETNLTGETWNHSVMLLGEGAEIPNQEQDRVLMARNFKVARYYSKYKAIVFADGEVRQGEPMLKRAAIVIDGGPGPFDPGPIIIIEYGVHRLSASADGAVGDPADEALRERLAKPRPSTNITVPTRVVSQDQPGPHFLTATAI